MGLEGEIEKILASEDESSSVKKKAGEEFEELRERIINGESSGESLNVPVFITELSEMYEIELK